MIHATTDRDQQLLTVTRLIDEFLKERNCEMIIPEKCLMAGFVMSLKDKGMIEFVEPTAYTSDKISTSSDIDKVK